jgi:hypothetical protein
VSTIIEVSGPLLDKVKRGEAVILGMIFYVPSADKLHIQVCGSDPEVQIAMLNKYGIPCFPLKAHSDGHRS